MDAPAREPLTTPRVGAPWLPLLSPLLTLSLSHPASAIALNPGDIIVSNLGGAHSWMRVAPDTDFRTALSGTSAVCEIVPHIRVLMNPSKRDR